MPKDDADTTTTSGEPTNDHPTVESLTAELDKAQREKDRASRIARKHQERLEALEDKLAEYEAKETQRLEGDKGKDSQEQLLVKYRERIEELERGIKEADSRVRTHILKDKVREAAKKIISDEAFDDFFVIYGDKFNLDAEGIPVVNGEIDSVETFLRQIAKTKTHFSAVSPARGSGDVKPGQGGTGSALTIRDLEKMPTKERRLVLAKNPDLRKEWMQQGE